MLNWSAIVVHQVLNPIDAFSFLNISESHFGLMDIFPSWTFFMCNFKFPFVDRSTLHSGHLYFFPPWTVLMWNTKLLFDNNSESQMVHNCPGNLHSDIKNIRWVDLIFFRFWNFKKYKVASTLFFSWSGPYFFCLQCPI